MKVAGRVGWHLPLELGCTYTGAGYLQVDGLQKTTIPGICAAGNATTPMRAVLMRGLAGFCFFS